jgi:ligand-binding sensor domain-containing protein
MLQNGLSANTVYCVIQDHYGYMWFGTWDGLNKYDGYNFTTYNRKDGLSNETINALLETEDGNLWIGTDEGLNFLNRATGRFTSFYHNPNDSTTINSNKINYLYQDKPGRIIICTDQGLCTFDLSDYTAQRFYNRESGVRRSPGNHINYFLRTDEESSWIATNFGLVEYNIRTKENRRHLHRPGDNTSLSNNNVRVIHNDTKGRIWVGTENGLNLFNPDQRTFKVFRNDPQNQNSLSHNLVEYLFEDSFGNFWIATDGGGLHLMDINTLKISRVEMQINRMQDTPTERIYSIFQDSQKNVWFGTFNGVFIIDRFKPKFRLFKVQNENPAALHNNFIWAFHEMSPNEIWIGTERGITIFDPIENKFMKLWDKNPAMEQLANIRVRSLMRDNANNIWIGTRDRGVFKLNLQTGETVQFQQSVYEKNSLSDNFVTTIFDDQNGQIWVGTENGLNLINQKTNAVTTYQHNPEAENTISNNAINDIYRDSKGDIWIATLNGLNLYNKKTNNFIAFNHTSGPGATASTNRLFCLYEDAENNFWIGTRGGGLLLFDRKNQTFKAYTTGEGLPNNLVYNILEDNKKNLWMSTNRGIAMFDKKKEIFVNFDVTDGLQSNEFNAKAALKTSAGSLLFGGMRGFNIFDPEAIQMNTSRPEILITSFKKFNRPQAGQLVNGDTIILQFDENFFSFEFSALDYTNALRSKYAYKLENHSHDWTYVDGRRNFAEYTNVSPGTYKFHIIGANNNGIWNFDGVSVNIIVKAPWYQTTFFRILAAISFMFLLWFFISTTIHRGKRKNEMEKKVLQIKKQLFDIQQRALRLQMNPHFIFNSLNSIQSFILSKDIDLAVKYLSKFSQLMRLILTNSLESTIPLSDEINALKHYLEIEKLRFDNKFDYTIQIAPEVDEDFTGVPPMIIQPYVENAIIHGLVHKPGKGSIIIKIDEAESGIRCTISDNGIGREKAKLIKKTNGLNTPSKGMLITQKRLEITNRDNANKISVKITDLKNSDDTPAGTMVHLFIQTIDL